MPAQEPDTRPLVPKVPEPSQQAKLSLGEARPSLDGEYEVLRGAHMPLACSFAFRMQWLALTHPVLAGEYDFPKLQARTLFDIMVFCWHPDPSCTPSV